MGRGRGRKGVYMEADRCGKGEAMGTEGKKHGRGVM